MARCFLPRIRPRHTLCSKLTLKKVPLGRAGEVDSTAIQVDYGWCKTASIIINFRSTHTASSYAHQVLHGKKKRKKTPPNEIAQHTDHAISS
jgi:hypothetical protein